MRPMPAGMLLTMLALVPYASLPAAEAPEGDPVFADGFEGQDECTWSDVVGAPADGDETEATATNLGTVDDCTGGVKTAELLHGRADVDFQRVHVEDTGCGLEIDFGVSDLSGARICAFAECDDGEPDLLCAAGAVAATSPTGRPGCCSQTGDLIDSLACTGGIGDDSLTLWIRLDQGVTACTPYEVVGNF